MRKLIVVVLALFVSALAACGDDDGGGGVELSSDEQEFVDAAMEDFDPEDAEPLDEEQSRCMVETFVDSVGVDRLEEIGVDPESFADDEDFPEGLTKEEAEGVVDGMDSCFDLSTLVLESIAADQTLTDDAKECLADAFDSKLMRNLMVTVLTEGQQAAEDDPEMVSELMSVFAECPEALQGMMGDNG